MKGDARLPSIPIIDTHIHLFDTTRPQGVPWPEKKDKVLYKPALPARYRKIVAPLGVTGAIVVEASPLLEDNQWILDIAETNTIIVGAVGNLEPGKPDLVSTWIGFTETRCFLAFGSGTCGTETWAKNYPDLNSFLI